MKTTVILSDELMRSAKLKAREEGLSFTKLIEESLIERINKKQSDHKFDQVQITPFQGDGLVDSGIEGNWSAIRDLLYSNSND
ncbi:MAG: hypothetical protein KDK41_17105 [Leptospiraceae bacterium]|nr:hypothetical protein [Leptospiraceae bacterium]